MAPPIPETHQILRWQGLSIQPSYLPKTRHHQAIAPALAFWIYSRGTSH